MVNYFLLNTHIDGEIILTLCLFCVLRNMYSPLASLYQVLLDNISNNGIYLEVVASEISALDLFC